MKVIANKLLPDREKIFEAMGKKKLAYSQEAEPEPEGAGQKLLRGGLRTAARVGESALGLPGDIASGTLGLGSYLTGGAIPSYEEVQEALPVSLPTSQDIRQKVTQGLTGEYLEPQNKVENFIDNVVGDLVGFMAPGKILTKAKWLKGPALKAAQFLLPSEGAGLTAAARRSFASNLAGLATEEITGSKSLGAGAKALTILGSNLYGGRGAIEKLKDQKYATVRDILDKEKPVIKAPQIRELEQELWKASETKLIGSDSKKSLQDLAKSLEATMFYQNAPVETLWNVRTSLRDEMRNGKLDHVKPQAYKVEKELTNLLNEYGSENKLFGQALSEGDALTQGLYASSGITRALDKYSVQDVVESKMAKLILGIGGVKTIPMTAAGLVARKAAKEASKAFDLVTSNTVVRKYLTDTYRAAFNENKAATIKAARNLDRAIRHIEKKEEA